MRILAAIFAIVCITAVAAAPQTTERPRRQGLNFRKDPAERMPNN